MLRFLQQRFRALLRLLRGEQMDEIPAMFQPGAKLGVIEGHYPKYFPDDEAGRWMLFMLTAAHDTGVAIKLFSAFVTASSPTVRSFAAYQTSHTLYFWRLLLAHVSEANVGVNRGWASPDPVISAIRADPNVAAAKKEINRKLGEKFGSISVCECLERSRATAFHYYDTSPFDWGKHLAEVDPQEPVGLVPESGRSSDSRWVAADHFVLCRTSDMKNRSLQLAVRDVAFELIGFINNGLQPAYFEARDKAASP